MFLSSYQVVHNVGLCIILFDIIEIGDSYILPGDGCAHVPGKLEFLHDLKIKLDYDQLDFVIFRFVCILEQLCEFLSSVGL